MIVRWDLPSGICADFASASKTEKKDFPSHNVNKTSDINMKVS